ncbi:MAG: glycosyltransferase family 39 protein [Chloroflexi bacterium]|nr:glycosyltransferase family 39 protein [Chloroflexota bacterium]
MTRKSFELSRIFSIFFAAGAIFFAALGQFLFLNLKANVPALIFYLAALVLWLFVLATGARYLGTPNPIQSQRAIPARKISRSLVAATTLLAFLTFLASGDNEFNSDNVLVWLLSIALFFYTFWEPEKTFAEWRAVVRSQISNLRNLPHKSFAIPWRAIILLAILALDIHDVVEGARPIFFARNTGREPFQFYATAAYIELFDRRVDFLALKTITATQGLLVVLFTFFLARELFDETTGFIAAAFVAISKWPIIIARVGLRFPLTPFFVAPTLYFLFRALKYKRRNDFLMLGFFLGAGLYGYNAFRIVPLLVALYFFLWLLLERNVTRAELKQYATNAALTVLMSIVVFVPLLRYMTENPDQFWVRSLSRLSSGGGAANSLIVLLDNIKNAFLSFNVLSDNAWPNGIAFDPALDFILGGLFVLGVAACLQRAVRHREMQYANLLICIFILLLPSALAIAFPIENPGFAREGGAIPLVMIVAALPLAFLARAILSASNSARARVIALIVVGASVLLIARVNYEKYFVEYDRQYRGASWNSSEVAAVVRSFATSIGDVDHAWILLYPHWIDTRNVAINLGDFGWGDHTLPDANAAQAQLRDGANKLYILNVNDNENLQRLQDLFPNGQLRVFKSRTPNHDFNLWYVPGTAPPDFPLNAPPRR